MTAPRVACDPDLPRRLLDDGLSADEQASLEAHLENCPACRQRLEEAAAGPIWWSEVPGHLGAGDPTRCEDESPADLLGMLAGLLAPTEFEGSLGRLGPYEIRGLVGRGGSGVVLKAFEPALARVVAVKILAPELAASGTARQRFAREARAAAAVVHDNVVPIHAVDEWRGLPYLVMPYLRGGSLEHRIRAKGALSLEAILQIGRQIAAGLAAAHAQGLIHRDIKPANVLLDEGVDRVWVADFGLARAVDDASTTRSGVIVGTPQYMSPEQAAGEAIDPRSDLFSLGSVLYTMATGRPPFQAETTLATLNKVRDGVKVPLRKLRPRLPAWLGRIVDRLHAKLPAGRYADAASVAALLEGCLAHLRQPGRVPLPADARPARHWHRWAAVLLLALVPVPFLGWVADVPQPEPARSKRPEPTTDDLDDAIRKLRQDVERLENDVNRP